MKTAVIHDYQSDFDSSALIDLPEDLRVDDPTNLVVGDQKILEILLTHPMPYKVEFKEDDQVEGQSYYATADEAASAKTEWEENSTVMPSGMPSGIPSED